MVKIILTCLALLMAHELVAQPYRGLIMEGAGVRGIAYVGAIRELEARGLMTDIQHVGGTSAGAIAALLVSLGYNSAEMESIIAGLRIQRFNDGRFLFAGGLVRLCRDFGWYRGEAFDAWLQQIIAARTGDGDITFAGLRQSGFKDLYVTGTSLTAQRTLIFCIDTYPDMKVRDAVRISISIPIYFAPVRIDSAGHVVQRSSSNVAHLVVDGGIEANFPIHLFDSVSALNGRRPNPGTIGLRVDTPRQIAHDRCRAGLAPVEIKTLKSFLSAFYSFSIESLNRHELTEADWQRTVSISCGPVGPRIRRLSSAEKQTLVDNGSDAMREFLN